MSSVPFPVGLDHPPLTMTPPALRVGRAQWGAVLHLLVFGCGWWRPGSDFERSRFEDERLGEGRQWLAWKLLPAWPGQEPLADFLGWAAALGDDLIEVAMPVPDAIRAAYRGPSNPVQADSGADHWSDTTHAEYRKLWKDQPPDPLDLASHCSAPWRPAGAPHWRDYPMGLPAPTTSGVVERPTPQLLLAVDSYAGWYLELCRRGLDESDPVLVSVHIRALGTLGTFRIGGGHRPHLVVDA